MKDGAVLVVSARSARGMAHQDLTKEWGVAPCLLGGLKVGNLRLECRACLPFLLFFVITSSSI